MGAVFLLQAKVAARCVPRFYGDGAIRARVGERSHFILEYEVGSLSYAGPDGPITIETRYTPRGNFRLEKENCSHAQLWLNLKKKQTKKTVFANQNKLKLVVQCKDSSRYQSYLRKEYQTYRMLNLITEASYR